MLFTRSQLVLWVGVGIHIMRFYFVCMRCTDLDHELKDSLIIVLVSKCSCLKIVFTVCAMTHYQCAAHVFF